jgi:two-component system cell cycle response regulator
MDSRLVRLARRHNEEDVMGMETLQVLMVEDDDVDARQLSRLLSDANPLELALHRVGSFGDAKRSLESRPFDAVLVDLGLPDCESSEVVLRLQADAPGVPIVVLTGLRCEQTARQMVEAGAQDYLIKGEISGSLLLRSLKYAVQRQRLRRELWTKTDQLRQSNLRLQRLSHVDPLTKVLNRRGLQQILTRETHLALEGGSKVCAMLADLDRFKQINDAYSHAAGDLALMTVGRCLKEIFGAIGHVARAGGDEFLVLFRRPHAARARHAAADFKRALALKRVRFEGRILPALSASVGLVEAEPKSLSLARLLSLCHGPLEADKQRARTPENSASKIPAMALD